MILDTNAVSAVLAGDPKVGEVLASRDRHELPAVVIGEYLFGLARSKFRKKLAVLLADLVAESVVLPTDEMTARAYATVREQLRRKGRPIPENDVWIGALALQHGLEVVSRDAHFDEIAGIRRRSW